MLLPAVLPTLSFTFSIFTGTFIKFIRRLSHDIVWLNWTAGPIVRESLFSTSVGTTFIGSALLATFLALFRSAPPTCDPKQYWSDATADCIDLFSTKSLTRVHKVVLSQRNDFHREIVLFGFKIKVRTYLCIFGVSLCCISLASVCLELESTHSHTSQTFREDDDVQTSHASDDNFEVTTLEILPQDQSIPTDYWLTTGDCKCGFSIPLLPLRLLIYETDTNIWHPLNFPFRRQRERSDFFWWESKDHALFRRLQFTSE